MKPAICNASPIIALSAIESLFLLTELFYPLYVPEAVYGEIMKETTDRPGSLELLQMLEKNAFQLYRVKNQDTVHQMYGKLHFGEIEVIVAAKELAVPFVILDDRSARKLAQTLLLRPIGTLGILRLAKQEGIISGVKPFVDRLISNNFRISRNIDEQIIKDE